jgi:hypothetical protein
MQYTLYSGLFLKKLYSLYLGTEELLDRVLVSPSWEEKFPPVCATTMPSELSDHTPILIKTGDRPRVHAIF